LRWLVWAVAIALLALEVALPYALPKRAVPWDDAQTAVAGFVAAIFSFTAGVWSFALRESLALREIRQGTIDPTSPEGVARLREMMLALWGLCLLIGAFGATLAWAASRPRAAWPYAAGAAVLLVVHAPRRWLLSAPEASPEG
jgi:hypothetical protein